jgi:protein CWC15
LSAVKRSWHEETVFKNQARSEPAAKKRFINDTIRSDFHKRFLNRYIK